MHELSIVSSLIELCEENARVKNASKIEEIVVKIGRLSGIEIELFKRCFDSFKEGSIYCKNALLSVEITPFEIHCLSCDKKSILEKNIFRCPKCDSIDLKVLSGEDMYLMRLIMT
ncbi:MULTISPECIES: hydrogenase maturation nickel metallochaperone HypA [unclassified Campylobacter]|uniref:hydrogenase maturation nickel metallochaperone HypA n=1 Tax=unclassified Campylobacter TaxID=2593542 RepID=UPI001238089D|nr:MULTISPECIES: hydrogenase maturation nickel metallochaperone HypA [unclassified Campylobacter]KAA6225439.1 hydrogenase maturation nickel metallochaperone HypA [Campylobacter sp. LR196d]KAA6228791.1 hydrogenase maturation nickel metallochaperone HypA [Campylobacter sp. LR185c]KAA6229927.1 hydrogenase maturation nickel metallochaperone HypA [Campylobacter sp. LR286c]KAA6234235.1 hydrogenase maturation nickel metallochaperone HypA [Campylobacter sp. LR291e]KAA8604156.1 hydrogenase maturation n